MKDNMMTTIMKFLVAAMVALVLMLAAFGVGVGVGLGQNRGATAAAAAAEQAELAVEAQPAEAMPTPASVAAQATRAAATPAAPARGSATPTLAATATRMPFPTPTRQDKSELPDEAPINVELLNEAWKLLKEQYYGNLPEGEDVTYAAIRGIISALSDRHTSFLDPDQAETFNTDMQGQFEGIGARVGRAEEGGVRIEHLFADQPAQKAGVAVGDVIIRVDGRDITMLDLNDAVAMIRGKRGTEVTLTIKRGDQTPFDLTVTRARIEIPIITTETPTARRSTNTSSRISSRPALPDGHRDQVRARLAREPARRLRADSEWRGVACQCPHLALRLRQPGEPRATARAPAAAAPAGDPQAPGKVSERGWTIVPLSMYLKAGRAKVEIALVRGKRSTTRRTQSPSAMRIASCAGS
jgi:hypothetical protein